jgi:hypothetical protein
MQDIKEEEDCWDNQDQTKNMGVAVEAPLLEMVASAKPTSDRHPKSSDKTTQEVKDQQNGSYKIDEFEFEE